MDWLFFLRNSNEGMFQIHSSEDVFVEVLYNMRKAHPTMSGDAIKHRRDLMMECVDEVIETFPSDVPFAGSDEHDYHVHAAAEHCRADKLLTVNDPGDFGNGTQHYEVISADDFYVLVAKSNPKCLGPIIAEQLAYWSKKPEFHQLDDALRRAGCPQFAEVVRNAIQRMA